MRRVRHYGIALGLCLLNLAGCGADPGAVVRAPRITLAIDKSACSCAPSSYSLTWVRSMTFGGTREVPCAERQATFSPQSPPPLSTIDQPSGSAVEFILESTCTIPGCVTCSARTRLNLVDGLSVTLALSPVQACRSEAVFLLPCRGR